ncbi:phosphoenolpyruvate--protein phosphotransferase [candidate division KSB1 bacterium]|nr:phosphoenolpyruvate--protein phosphotransferase [candidate division KSB1 bacterium]
MEQKYKHLLKGISASPGIAIGKVFHLRGDVIKIEERDLDESEVEQEIEKFKNAIEEAKADLRKLTKHASRKLGVGNATIFDVHRMLLEDETIVGQTIEIIRSEQKNADLIFFRQMNQFQKKMEQLNDEFFKERATDIIDVKRRVLQLIQGERRGDYLARLSTPHIIVARELTPSDTITLDRRKILAFATDIGGRTSHAAIMARALEIPSVLGLKNISELIAPNDRIIVDGNHGEVIINPSPETLDKYRKLQGDYYDYERKLTKIRELPCRTLDGKDIELSANLEFPDEIESVISHGAKGIGLYRTEYLFLAREELPSEEEQFQAYDSVASKIYPESVIIRTADLGGDKSPDSLKIPQEDNPFLGWRAIRICLKETEMFKAQLRAILRASARGNVKIMFPMITTIEELDQCIQLLNEAKQELDSLKQSYNANIDIGTMIEVPSAAIMTDVLAKRISFLSIGTNDLIQYTLAADRGNERIAYLYENVPPAVIRLIKQVVESGHKRGVWVGMCGEMASDPLAIMILVGLGLDELSVSPIALPEIKQIIRSIKFSDAAHIAQKVMQMENGAEIKKYIRKVMAKRFKDFPFI